MSSSMEMWKEVIIILQSIHSELHVLNNTICNKPGENGQVEFVHVPFRCAEIYLLHKAFIDAGGCPTENYKSLLEKTSCRLSNKNQKGFSAESLKKASDKLDIESKENIKRFLQRMIRNIDSYD